MKKRKYEIEVVPECNSAEFFIEAKGRKKARKLAEAYVKKELNGNWKIYAIREVKASLLDREPGCTCGCSSCELHKRNCL